MAVWRNMQILFLSLYTALSTSYLAGEDWKVVFDVSGGYREDKITTTINSFVGNHNLVFTDDLKIDGIESWILQSNLRVEFCNCWFVRGYIDCGWVENGKYRETIADAEDHIFITKASVDGGRMWDGSAGLGWLYRVDPYFRLGPIAGWSYHYQSVTMKNGFSDGEPDEVLEGLTYQNRWQSPWLGVEALISQCGFEIDVGYEYHWPRWHADWLLAGPDVFGGAFSDRRKAHHGYGNITFIDVGYRFCNSVLAGVKFKYQYWKATNGYERPKAGSFAEVGLPSTEIDRVQRAIWREWDVQFSIGFDY